MCNRQKAHLKRTLMHFNLFALHENSFHLTYIPLSYSISQSELLSLSWSVFLVTKSVLLGKEGARAANEWNLNVLKIHYGENLLSGGIDSTRDSDRCKLIIMAIILRIRETIVTGLSVFYVTLWPPISFWWPHFILL